MKAVILLALVSGASAFLKTEMKSKAATETKLSSWEQMQEDALERAGAGIPKTVIRVAWAPMASSLLEQQGSAHAAQEVTIKAQECTQCAEEHLTDIAPKIQALSGEQYAEACSFCALYAFGGVYAGQDAQVHPKAWTSLPKDKISVIKDESIIASPPRKAFWKEAVDKVIAGTWSLPNAIAEASSQMNVLECDTAVAASEMCTVSEKPSGGVAPMVLMEVHSKAALASKYNKVHSGIQSLMGQSESMMANTQMDLMMAEQTGDKVMASIAKEALEAMKQMTDQVVEEEDNLRKQLDAKEAANPAALLQTQKIEMDTEQDMPMIKESVREAVAYVQSGQEPEEGEAVLNAARKLLMPITNIAEMRKSGMDTTSQKGMEQLTKMDEVIRKVILGLSEADTVSSLAQGAAVQSLEEAATQLYKQHLSASSDDHIASQATDITKQLARLLPQKKKEEKKVVLKAKDTQPVVRKGEEANKDAMKALEGALSTQTKPSLVQKDASHQDVAKMDKAMKDLDGENAKLDEANELASLESDLAELGGQDKVDEAW